jgi:hypothetical protein
MELRKRIIRLAIVTLIAMLGFTTINAQFYYQNSNVFIGQRPTNWSGIVSDIYPGAYIGPDFGLEYYNSGLNFWKPFGASNWGNYKLFIASDGRVGIGNTPTSSYQLQVFGNIASTGFVTVGSDERLKRNITDIGDNRAAYIGKLMKLNGKFYEKQVQSSAGNAEEVARMVKEGRISPENAQEALAQLNQTKKDVYVKEFGFLAQELKELFPELVTGSYDEMYSVNYSGLIPILLEAVKDLQEKVTKLENLDNVSLRSGSTSNDVFGSEEFLSQNIPNPFDGNTIIRYSLPEGTNQASITIYSSSGAMAKNIPLNANEKKGSITLSSAELKSGIFIYNLIANGVVLGSRKMVNQ